MLGIYAIVQVVVCLMVSSQNLPSLGILFETIRKSRSDFLMFTMIFQLMFIALIVMFHLLFGLHLEVFSEVLGTSLTLLQMMFGEYDYSAMYRSNPTMAAGVFLIFVYVFYFLIMYMYVTIVTRTYNKLRAKKLFISEAMARIITNRVKNIIYNWYCLIFFQ